MKCSDLPQNANVIFKAEDDFENGSVLYVDNALRAVCVCYLEGYKSREAHVPFGDMVAMYDEAGESMTFGCFTGPSVMLEPD